LRVAEKLDDPSTVQAQLLVQASNQLRVLELAAERGYALQSLGVAATLYEHVSAIAFVDGRPEEATKWRSHTDPRHTYPPVKQRAEGMRRMLTKGGVASDQIEARVSEWEEHYARFCVAKHGNPILLNKYAVAKTVKAITLHLGPLAGPVPTTLARIALFHGSRLLADASVLFANPRLSKRSAEIAAFKRLRTRFLRRLEAVAAEYPSGAA
jgi:hypothetical protein